MDLILSTRKPLQEEKKHVSVDVTPRTVQNSVGLNSVSPELESQEKGWSEAD